MAGQRLIHMLMMHIMMNREVQEEEGDDGDDSDIFLYTGGDQVVPRDVRRAQVAESANHITKNAFQNCTQLRYVQFHDGLKKIEVASFAFCPLLRRIKIPPGTDIGEYAFAASGVRDVELGEGVKIGACAFCKCTLLTHIEIPKAAEIEELAFAKCPHLKNVDLAGVRKIGRGAFLGCPSLERVELPLFNLDVDDAIGSRAFDGCKKLTTIDLTEDVHETVSSLGLECWRNQMKEKISRINRVHHPNTTPENRTQQLEAWMMMVHDGMEHCKREHQNLLREATTRMELAAWKIYLNENEAISTEHVAKKAKLTNGMQLRPRKCDMERLRQENRVRSGASVIIENVLPFLKLK